MKSEAPILQTVGLTAKFGDRVLFSDLNLCLGRDKAALVGRNGVGKSTLLDLLSGETRSDHGTVTRRGEVRLVRQSLSPGPRSPGQQRRSDLQQARASGADLLLLDEPTQDLDENTVGWLRSWLSSWGGGLVVATHDRRLLDDFQHFFVMAESGCRYFSGPFELLEKQLEKEFKAGEARYIQRLNHLAREEEQSAQSGRRRKRKEQYGRVRQIDRATSRALLNLKRSQAQVNHGRINSLREERLEEVRDWTKAARRSLKVELPLELEMPVLPSCDGPVIVARGISMVRDSRCLFQDVTLALGRERVAVTGPNGAGKTTLLQTLAGNLKPDKGAVQVQTCRLGIIEQGGANWMLDESLVEYLARFKKPDEVGRSLVTQKFPLALAERPLRSLSPGERVRAALIGLLAQDPPVEMLVLDEPSYSLDLLGQKALGELLKAWPGGLLIASHNSEFLQSVGIQETLRLGGTLAHVQLEVESSRRT